MGLSWRSKKTQTASGSGEASARLRELWRVLPPRDREALLGTLAGKPAQRLSLRARGLVTEEGRPFGEVLAEWLREEL